MSVVFYRPTSTSAVKILLLFQRVQSRSLEDVVILNVDNNTLESPFDDLHNLPSDVVGDTHTHTHIQVSHTDRTQFL